MDFSFQPYYPVYSDASILQEQPQRAMPFAMPVSSYFRRPSKIVKSRNQSPKRLVRRRTTAATHGHPRHPSMDQLPRRTHTKEPNFNQERPLSWHPSSYEQPVEYPQDCQLNFFPHFGFSTSPFSTTEINGLITPMSAPVPNEPRIQEYIAPLEDSSSLTYSSMPFANDYTSKMGACYVPEQSHYVEHQAYAPDQMPYGHHYTTPQMYQTQQINQSLLHIDTAPPSPTLLPIQNFHTNGSTSPCVLGSPRVDTDELVGMGLYDRPQDVQSSSGELTSMAALTAGIGKGLKLEESFEPSAAEDDEADEEDEEEHDEVEDFRNQTTAMTNDSNMLPLHSYAEDYSRYAEQTIFVDDQANQRPMPAAERLVYPQHQSSAWIMGNDQPYGWI